MNKSISDVLSNVFMSKKKRTNMKIDKLKQEVLECIELCKMELENRRNGIEGESTIEQLEEIIIPDLSEFLIKLENKDISTKKEDRYLVSFWYAFKEWGWNMDNATELYKKLTDIHHGYQGLM